MVSLCGLEVSRIVFPIWCIVIFIFLVTFPGQLISNWWLWWRRFHSPCFSTLSLVPFLVASYRLHLSFLSPCTGSPLSDCTCSQFLPSLHLFLNLFVPHLTGSSLRFLFPEVISLVSCLSILCLFMFRCTGNYSSNLFFFCSVPLFTNFFRCCTTTVFHKFLITSPFH